MSNTRSQRLAHWETTTGDQWFGLEVPDPHVLLLKSALFENAAAVDTWFELYIQDSQGPVHLLTETLTPGAIEMWSGWIALNPLDLIVAHIAGSGGHIWLSGAILLGPPPFPELPAFLRPEQTQFRRERRPLA